MKASVERVPSQEGGAGERRRPKQARSQATEDALLDAGLACIEAVGIEATSMALVAERAGASIGALYFRFGDKERFVQAALARAFDRIRAETDALLAYAVMQDKPPAAVIVACVDLAVKIQSRSQGVLRAVLKRALDDPAAWEPVGRLGNEVSGRLVDTLARYPEVTAIPGWRDRIMLAMHAARAMHFNSLYNPQSPLPSDPERMVAALSDLVLGHLGLPPDTGAEPARSRAQDKAQDKARTQEHAPTAAQRGHRQGRA